jgi:hypothetical protein
MYIYVYTCIYMYIYMYVYLYIRIYMCVCVCVCMYIYMQGGRLLRETETEVLVGALQQPPASQPATQPATLSAVLLGVTLPPPSRAKNDRDEPSKNTETGGFKSAGFEPAAGGGGGGVTPPLASMDTPGSVTLNEKKEAKEKNSDAEVREDIYIYILL